ncbi:hypothetical protein QTN25_000358 [Entamoeba marina]
MSEGLEDSNKDVWGELKCLTPDTPTIPLKETSIEIGKKNPNCKITTKAISWKHCKVARKMVDKQWIYILIDTSTNGTYLNHKQLMKGEEVIIKPFDEITLLSPIKYPTSCVTYCFIVYEVIEQEHNSCEFFQNYDLLDFLGSGGFGIVRKTRDIKSSTSYAVKLIPLKKGRNTNEQEVVVMKSLQHQLIVNIKDCFTSKQYHYIVMDLVTGGDLYQILRRIEPKQLESHVTKKIMSQLFTALKYLHSHNIIHRDLKLDNILFTGEGTNIKIADFGTGRIVGENMTAHTLCGTPSYVCPEIIQGLKNRENVISQLKTSNDPQKKREIFERYSNSSKEQGYDGSKADMWSAGVILYLLTVGHFPFIDKNGKNDISKALNGDFIRDEQYTNSPLSFKELIESLLVVDPYKRLSAAECLDHEYFLIATQKNFTPQPKKSI